VGSDMVACQLSKAPTMEDLLVGSSPAAALFAMTFTREQAQHTVQPLRIDAVHAKDDTRNGHDIGILVGHRWLQRVRKAVGVHVTLRATAPTMIEARKALAGPRQLSRIYLLDSVIKQMIATSHSFI
jgi:hypothetical protein